MELVASTPATFVTAFWMTCPFLDPDTADLSEGAAGGVVVCDELGDDSEWLGGIDSQASTVERLVAETISVEVAAVLITDTIVTFIAGTTVSTRATGLPVDRAGMRGVGRGDAVCLPDIHLTAASTV